MRHSSLLSLLAISLSLALPLNSAASVIGIFGDTGAMTCAKAFTAQYTTVEVYFIAMLDDTEAISACEFGATGVNLPPNIITVTWDTPLVIGNILTADGVALAFSTPKTAPLAYLGKIAYFLLAPLASNSVMQVVPSAAGNLVVVDAGTASEIPVEGWGLVANCVPGGPYGDCQCPPYFGGDAVQITVSSPIDGSAIDNLYDINFTVGSVINNEPAAFSGSVKHDGLVVETFSGYDFGDFSVPRSTQGEPHGSQHFIEVLAANGQSQSTVSVDYTTSDMTPPSALLQFPPAAYQFSGGALVLEATGEDFHGPLGMRAEFFREEPGATAPTTEPILVASSDDGHFIGACEIVEEDASLFDIGVVIVDAAGNRSPYVAHTVYFYPLNYRITIDVDGLTAHDWGAVAGVFLGAGDSYDPLIDLPEPPTPPLRYVSCYFPHDDWDSPFGHRFNADVRTATDFMGLQKVWDFTVSTDLLNQPFTMSFAADPAFIDSLPTYIHDLEADEYYNLHEVTQFDFNSGAGGERHFQLVIGPSEALPGVVEADFASGWNLLGLPLLPADPGAGMILGDDVGSSYFLYGYSENSGYLPVTSLDLNTGYWLGLFAPATIDVSGSAQVDTLVAALADPWQMVGTSLYKNLALDRTRVRYAGQTLLFNDAVQAGWISPAVYGWNPAQRVYAAADTLELWRGYWVGQLVDGAELLFHKDWGYIPVGRPDTPPDPVITWRVGFEASTSTVTERAYLGAHSLATRGFDVPFDFPKPPVAPGGGSIYMSFAHPDWRCVLGDHFNRDIRALAPDGQAEVWTLRVATTQESTLLTWPYWEGGVPEDYAFILDDLGTPANEHIDMREAGSYRLLGAGVHQLLITAGSNLSTPSEELPPQANALLGVHPNPFNPTTKISFAVREAATVDLTIFGIDGRRIVTLATGRLDAGRHEQVWDGCDASGRSVPSGIYFARLTIGEETFRTKLALLK